jgi:hypothetical protein
VPDARDGGGIEAPVTDDQENEKRRSRRARRREQAEQGEGADAETSSDADEAPEGSDEAATDQDPETEGEPADAEPAETADDAEADDETSSEPEPAERPRRKKKKKKKRSSAERDARDRNLRVRNRAEARREARRRRAAPVRGLEASEMVDDAFARHAQVVTNWLKEHFNIVQWFVLAGIVFGIGYWIYSWHTHTVLTKASDDLAVALADENGRIMSQSEPETADEEEFDTRPQFPSEKARLTATAAAYRKVMQARKGSGASILAELGLAGTLYDEGRYDDAASTYRKVKESALAAHDPDVKGRALEGLGMSLEGKGDVTGANKAYRELASTDQPGFVALGLFHQAEIAYNRGQKTDALDDLHQAQKKLSDPKSAYDATGYLAEMIRSLANALSPGQSSEFSEAELEKIRETDPTKLQELLKRMGKVPGNAAPLPGMPPGEMPGMPPAPAPAPQPTGSAP